MRSHDAQILLMGAHVPCCQVLREPLMLVHHVGFVMTAYYVVTQNCNTYYALCFFGVVEVSSVLLCFADVFHPKHKEYTAWLCERARLQ